jgi:glycosyltransferase involved in cell wall biosynthesis
MKKLLTIVVPVYKVEKYINKCLNSLILPVDLMDKLEVIIVNDGTPDHSAEMAREYVKRFPMTFHIFDKENGGHGSAWNVGLKQATGKYIRFLDSDDWLTNLPVFMNYLENVDVDLVFTHLNKHFEKQNADQTIFVKNMAFNKVHNAESFEWSRMSYTFIANFWFCTYRTSMLQKESPLFKEHVIYDDSILFVAPIILAKSFVAFDIILYNYLLGREGQSMADNNLVSRINDRIVTQQHLGNFCKSHKISSSHKTAIVDSIMYNCFFGLYSTINSFKYSDCKKWQSIWCNYVRKEYPNMIRANMMKLFYILPFPLYYCIMSIAKRIK